MNSSLIIDNGSCRHDGSRAVVVKGGRGGAFEAEGQVLQIRGAVTGGAHEWALCVPVMMMKAEEFFRVESFSAVLSLFCSSSPVRDR
jgi:hypothetical protein